MEKLLLLNFSCAGLYLKMTINSLKSLKFEVCGYFFGNQFIFQYDVFW